MADMESRIELVEKIGPFLLPSAALVEIWHGMQLRRFGGGSGIRDRNLLEGAVSRGASTLLYGDAGDLVAAVCAMCEGVIRNHPFIDGNKRAGFSVIASTLPVNGFLFEMSPRDAAQMIVDFAAGKISSDDFRDTVRANVRPDPTHGLIEEISAAEATSQPEA